MTLEHVPLGIRKPPRTSFRASCTPVPADRSRHDEHHRVSENLDTPLDRKLTNPDDHEHPMSKIRAFVSNCLRTSYRLLHGGTGTCSAKGSQLLRRVISQQASPTCEIDARRGTGMVAAGAQIAAFGTGGDRDLTVVFSKGLYLSWQPSHLPDLSRSGPAPAVTIEDKSGAALV